MKKTSSLLTILLSLVLCSGLVFCADFTDSATKQRESAGNKIFEFYNQEIASNSYVEKIFDDSLRYRFIDYYLTTSTGTITCLASFRNANGTIVTQNVVSGTGITNFYSDLLTLKFTMAGATGNVTGNIRFYNSASSGLASTTTGNITINNLNVVTPTIYNLTIPTANTEYSQVLPATTRRISVSIQDGIASENYRIAFVTGKVATPTAPYLKYFQDIEYAEKDINLAGYTIYLAASIGSKVAQILAWE